MTTTIDPGAPGINSTVVRPKELERLAKAFGLAERIRPSLAAKLAGELFRRPRRHARPEREVAWCRDAEQISFRYVAPPGAARRSPRELSALSFGKGPLVLLLHGWEGRASQMGAFAAPLVEAGFRVVAIDAPAHGESKGRTSSMLEYTAALYAAERALGPVHGVVAHSLGTAATSLALDEGFGAERIAFLSPPYDLDVYFHLFIQALGLGPDIHRLMIEGYERQFQHSWDDLRRVTVAGHRPQPLLVVSDEDDQETPLAGGQAVAAAWQAGRLVATSGLGHRRILRNLAVTKTVTEHITRS